MSSLLRRSGACDKLGHSSAAAVYAMVYYGLPLPVTRCTELNKMMVFVAVSDLLPYIHDNSRRMVLNGLQSYGSAIKSDIILIQRR